VNQPAMIVLDQQPVTEPMYHVYRNGEFMGELNREGMMQLVASFNGADRVMVYRLLRD
jgi:hypothetical protein